MTEEELREQFEQVVSVHKGTAFLVNSDGVGILIAYAEQEHANRREAERERDEAREPDDEFMNELLANAPEAFNGDDDQDDAVRYVRWLESERCAAQVVVQEAAVLLRYVQDYRHESGVCVADIDGFDEVLAAAGTAPEKRQRLELNAISARARGDYDAERKALDGLALIERAAPENGQKP